MQWQKLGLVYRSPSANEPNVEWRRHSALTPTPFNLSAEVVRVYCGFRDPRGVSRIGYVDVDAQNPTRILKVSETPVLDIGRAGCFDDNGVILGDVIRVGTEVWMYYVGFQLVKNVKFLAFSGLAVSADGAETFQRKSETPVLDRAPNATYIHAIHTVRYNNGTFRAWYAQGDGWEVIKGQAYPQYEIGTLTSNDGIHFNTDTHLCIKNDSAKNEYRIGRPSVFKLPTGDYGMFFTRGSTSGEDYTPGFASSPDGINWLRDDQKMGLMLSNDGWDSKHLCYPRMVETSGANYAFYNGNDMGRDGFGVAKLLSWT